MQMMQVHTIITTHRNIESGQGAINGDQAEL